MIFFTVQLFGTVMLYFCRMERGLVFRQKRRCYLRFHAKLYPVRYYKSDYGNVGAQMAFFEPRLRFMEVNTIRAGHHGLITLDLHTLYIS